MSKQKTTVLYLTFLLSVFLILISGCRKKQAKLPSGAIRAGNITIIDTRTDQTDRARAKQNAEDALVRYSDIDCMVGLWAYNGPAILSALEDADKLGNVKIVCFDEEEDVLQGISAGHIYATVVQQPYEFGYQSVRILAGLARGDRTVVPKDKVLDIPVKVINRDNVAAFWQNLKKLLSDTGVADDEDPRPGGDKVSIALLSNSTADFWRIARAGIRKAEKDFNAKCQFLMPPTGSAEEQQRMIESLIARKVSGLAISPVDPANQIDMINQACTRMNVITQDSDAAESNRICYVGTNNYKAGRQAGKLIRKVLPNGGKLMLFVGSLDAQNAIDRRQGIIDELSGTI